MRATCPHAGPDDPNDKPGKPSREGQVALKDKPKVQQPKMFKVLIHNDNFTTMEFVVYVLTNVFHHSETAATRIMLHIHHSGVGVAGVFTREIAQAKTRKVLELARQNEFPLQCTFEEA